MLILLLMRSVVLIMLSPAPLVLEAQLDVLDLPVLEALQEKREHEGLKV